MAGIPGTGRGDLTAAGSERDGGSILVPALLFSVIGVGGGLPILLLRRRQTDDTSV